MVSLACWTIFAAWSAARAADSFFVCSARRVASASMASAFLRNSCNCSRWKASKDASFCRAAAASFNPRSIVARLSSITFSSGLYTAHVSTPKSMPKLTAWANRSRQSKPSLPTRSPMELKKNPRRVLRLDELNHQRHHQRVDRDGFGEGHGQDHRRLEFAGRFRVAADGLHRLGRD